jgi:hypothetical protein
MPLSNPSSGKRYPKLICLARLYRCFLGTRRCRCDVVGFLGERMALSLLSERCTQKNLFPSEWPAGIGTVMLPAHGLIKLKLRHGFGFFRFIEIPVIHHRPQLLIRNPRVLQRVGGILVPELARHRRHVPGLLDDMPPHGVAGRRLRFWQKTWSTCHCSPAP